LIRSFFNNHKGINSTFDLFSGSRQFEYSVFDGLNVPTDYSVLCFPMGRFLNDAAHRAVGLDQQGRQWPNLDLTPSQCHAQRCDAELPALLSEIVLAWLAS
jgi:hypothetical protein